MSFLDGWPLVSGGEEVLVNMTKLLFGKYLSVLDIGFFSFQWVGI